MERETLLPAMLVVSFGATLACWVHIWRSVDHLFFKITGALIAALPFFGPIFYFFTRLLPRLPEDAQAPLGLWGTSVREQTTAEMFKAWRSTSTVCMGLTIQGERKRPQRAAGQNRRGGALSSLRWRGWCGQRASAALAASS